MSVNKKIDSQEYKQTLASILPVQFEPGSLADRLLIQGREEGREEGRKEGMHRGKLTGMIQVLQELLGDAPMPDEAFSDCDIEALAKQLEELQQRLRARQG